MLLRDRLLKGGVTLVFDAANLNTRVLFALAKRAAVRGATVRRVVPSTAHWEKVLDLRQAKGSQFDHAIVLRALEDAGVEVLVLDADAVAAGTQWLQTLFPADLEWQDAKRKRLGFTGTRSFPATIDWVTASMCPSGAMVVSDDNGVEFKGVERIRSKELEAALRSLDPVTEMTATNDAATVNERASD